MGSSLEPPRERHNGRRMARRAAVGPIPTRLSSVPVMTYTTCSFFLLGEISKRKRPSRHIVEKAAFLWAWVDSNYRPHAYQAPTEEAKSRHIADLFTGGTHDLPLLRQVMPESAAIYRPNDRPKTTQQSTNTKRDSGL